MSALSPMLHGLQQVRIRQLACASNQPTLEALEALRA